MQRKFFFIVFSFVFLLPFFSDTELERRVMMRLYKNPENDFPKKKQEAIPDLLSGIWRGNDRCVFFMQGKKNNIAIVLETYYGWFFDRAAEPENFSKKSGRFLCTATTKEAEHISAAVEAMDLPRPKFDADGNEIAYGSGAWELVLSYNGNKKYNVRIPFAIIGNELYFDFVTKSGELSNENENTDGNGGEKKYEYWKGVCQAKTFSLAPYLQPKELRSYVVAGRKTFPLRYWETSAAYTDDSAFFYVGGDKIEAAKQIVSNDCIFSCVEGRRKEVRNIAEGVFPKDAHFDESKTICVFGKAAFTKILGKSRAEDLIAIINEANKRRKPDPPPLFPPEKLDWHWDIISMLEKDNKLIREVRESQKRFAETNGKEGRIDAACAAMYNTHIKLQSEVLSAAGLENENDD